MQAHLEFRTFVPRLLAAPLTHPIQVWTATLDHMVMITCNLAGMGLDAIDKTDK